MASKVKKVKTKTHKGVKKRFRVKSSGLLKRKKAGTRHILSNKSSKRKRQLGGTTHVHPADSNPIKKQLGIK